MPGQLASSGVVPGSVSKLGGGVQVEEAEEAGEWGGQVHGVE